MISSIRKVVSHLKQGDIIVYPTDTLYALGADIFNESAIRSIFNIKHRPHTSPLPIAVGSIEQMEELAVLTEIAKKLITNYLPGPLTIVVEKKPTISNLLTAGKQTVAIRIPNNIFTLKLLRTFGPLTVTSANIHKMDTPVTIKEIKTLFPVSSISIFIDDGPCNSRPSTIVDCTKNHPKILREGIISIHDILSME